VTPGGESTKLGQIFSTPDKGDSGEIVGTTTLTNFGLFMTVEDSAVMKPTSRIYSVFQFTVSP
jgi:hypothetical protein